jgi:DNA-binding MarR family transcriptional regulator
MPTKPASRTRPEAPAAVLRKFRIVFNAVKGHFREVERQAGLAGAQVWALSVLREQPGIGVGELAQALDIHQSTASNLVKPLIEQGFVAAARNEDDRRAVHLHISVKGLKVLKKAPGPAAGILPEALARLDPQVLQRLDTDLDRLIGEIHGDRRAGKVPLGAPDD